MTVNQEADAIINGDRQEAYGSPTDNWQRVADLVNAMLSHKLIQPITAEEMALILVQVKISREVFAHRRDNLVDIAGYAGLVDLIRAGRKEE